MATTLPSLTQTIDNAFLTTWYDIRPVAIDNILAATPVWALLNAVGALKTQEGSEFITRTIRYGQDTATAIRKGDLLPVGEVELETMAIWKFRALAAKVQRDLFDDQKNRGPSKIKDFVGLKLQGARDALEQKFETALFTAQDSTETTSKEFQSLHDIVPPSSGRTSGTYGGIARPSGYTAGSNGVEEASAGNTWWGPKYLPGVLASIEDDLVDDMKKLYNSIHNNQVPPNLILWTQAMHEIYESFALDASQIVKDEATMLADLGFEVLRFKGKPCVWTPNMTANHAMFLTTDFMEFVYDPSYWFAATDWKPIPLETKRIMHITCFGNLIATQPRRFGRLQYA